MPRTLEVEKHLNYLKNLEKTLDEWSFLRGEYMRMDGLYWGLVTLFTLRPELQPCSEEFDALAPLTREQIVDFCMQCQGDAGGFSGHVGLDVHVLSTLSAIQVLFMVDALDDPRFTREKHTECKSQLTVNY